MQHKILIVDDDRDLLKMLKQYLELKGYLVYTAGDGSVVPEKLKEEPDLILLDVNMPVTDGITVCREIRSKVTCPILFLTAKAEEQDRVNGLLSGGDDYILKPFSLKELDARIVAHLRREDRHGTKAKIRFSGRLVIDYKGKKVLYQDKKLELTKLEYGIVEFLSGHAGQVFDKERIYESVCGYDADGDSRVITELIRRIRNKLAECTSEEFIQTVWGSGYKWKK